MNTVAPPPALDIAPEKPFLSEAPVTAFALGGLGGFNAHGAGFLKAALEEQIRPGLISCTSGQIYYVWRYLLERDGLADPLSDNRDGDQPVDLKTDIEKAARAGRFWPKPLNWLDGMTMAVTGDPGVFEPARKEYFSRLFSPYFRSTPGAFWDDLPQEVLNRLLPAHLFNPTRSPELMTDIAERIASDTESGIIFNAWATREGEEILYINEQAHRLIQPASAKVDHNNRYGDTRVIVLKNPRRLRGEGRIAEAEAATEAARQAVENALWLYFYGFEEAGGQERSVVDGAYHRQLIIAELAPAADLIFSVKPQSDDWNARMPKNALQVQNFTTQLWFNSSYSGETARIDFINELVSQGVFEGTSRQHYRHIRLETVEYSAHIGFFDYFVERMNVFSAARKSARDRFNQLRIDGVLSAGEPHMQTE